MADLTLKDGGTDKPESHDPDEPEITPSDLDISATSELAALLSAEQEVNAAGIDEPPIELAAESGDARISWSVLVPRCCSSPRR